MNFLIFDLIASIVKPKNFTLTCSQLPVCARKRTKYKLFLFSGRFYRNYVFCRLGFTQCVKVLMVKCVNLFCETVFALGQSQKNKKKFSLKMVSILMIINYQNQEFVLARGRWPYQRWVFRLIATIFNRKSNFVSKFSFLRFDWWTEKSLLYLLATWTCQLWVQSPLCYFRHKVEVRKCV